MDVKGRVWHELRFALENKKKENNSITSKTNISIITYTSLLNKGLSSVHKRRPQSEGVVQCRQFADKGKSSSDADVCTFWCKKLWIFQNLWWVRTEKEGVGWAMQCGHFSDKRGGINFSRFCADVFYGRS